MDLLGTRIKLKSWAHFRAGLDTKSTSTSLSSPPLPSPHSTAPPDAPPDAPTAPSHQCSYLLSSHLLRVNQIRSDIRSLQFSLYRRGDTSHTHVYSFSSSTPPRCNCPAGSRDDLCVAFLSLLRSCFLSNAFRPVPFRLTHLLVFGNTSRVTIPVVRSGVDFIISMCPQRDRDRESGSDFSFSSFSYHLMRKYSSLRALVSPLTHKTHSCSYTFALIIPL